MREGVLHMRQQRISTTGHLLRDINSDMVANLTIELTQNKSYKNRRALIHNNHRGLMPLAMKEVIAENMAKSRHAKCGKNS